MNDKNRTGTREWSEHSANLTLAHVPQIRWKDSIQKVIEKAGEE